MKKHVTFILALVLALALTACKKEKASKPAAQGTTPHAGVSDQNTPGAQAASLHGYAMDKLYSLLYKSQSFLDGEDFGPITPSGDYGFGSLNADQYTDSVLDTGIAEDGGYMIAMFRLESGVDAQEFVYSLQSVADPWQLSGEGLQYVAVYNEEIVVYFAATGTLGSKAAVMQDLFVNTYAMTTTGVNAQ